MAVYLQSENLCATGSARVLEMQEKTALAEPVAYRNDFSLREALHSRIPADVTMMGRGVERKPMSNDYDQSVTHWIQGLKDGREDAAAALWQHYFQRLVHVSGRKLGAASRRVADEEDIAVTAFKSLCLGAAAGRFERLESRDDLWQILVALASRKAVDQIRRNVSLKRGGGTVRGDSIVMSADHDEPGGFEQFIGQDPTPEVIACVEEQCQAMLAQLPDDTLRQLATLRLEGYSNEEIAEKTQLSLRSVERKLGVIREVWTQHLPSSPGSKG